MQVVSLQLTVDGQDAGCFVVRLDVETAPTMCTKFLGLCRLEPGYRNTSVFKTQPNFSLMAGWVDAEWRHQFFYTADRSTLLERRGSVRMHINRVIDGYLFLFCIGSWPLLFQKKEQKPSLREAG